MYDVSFDVTKSLYPAQAILKATYAFIASHYVHIDETDDHWIVRMTAKEGNTRENVTKRAFENELIAQSVRLSIYQKTHHIREMLFARAMSSTLILGDEQKGKTERIEDDVDEAELASILTDWFDSHE